ncbi:hypothetical protein [Bradyrhizobium genosp. P]|uniref:hypothetical protein n=1 Tax=Bradyrhizobium genosp. P TaxID=83641 RepID=UPI003CEA1ACB
MAIAIRKAGLDFDAAPITSLPTLRIVETAAPKLASLPATNLHPGAVAIPVATAAWFVVVAWCAFGGGETSLVLAVIALFFLIFFGLFVGGAAMGRDMTPERARNRSFREFLDGDVDVGTGRITGREALWQLAAMPVGLAVGFTIIAMIAVSV